VFLLIAFVVLRLVVLCFYLYVLCSSSVSCMSKYFLSCLCVVLVCFLGWLGLVVCPVFFLFFVLFVFVCFVVACVFCLLFCGFVCVLFVSLRVLSPLLCALFLFVETCKCNKRIKNQTQAKTCFNKQKQSTK
jgi:hypothetical protein